MKVFRILSSLIFVALLVSLSPAQDWLTSLSDAEKELLRADFDAATTRNGTGDIGEWWSEDDPLVSFEMNASANGFGIPSAPTLERLKKLAPLHDFGWDRRQNAFRFLPGAVSRGMALPDAGNLFNAALEGMKYWNELSLVPPEDIALRDTRHLAFRTHVGNLAVIELLSETEEDGDSFLGWRQVILVCSHSDDDKKRRFWPRPMLPPEQLKKTVMAEVQDDSSSYIALRVRSYQPKFKRGEHFIHLELQHPSGDHLQVRLEDDLTKVEHLQLTSVPAGDNWTPILKAEGGPIYGGEWAAYSLEQWRDEAVNGHLSHLARISVSVNGKEFSAPREALTGLFHPALAVYDSGTEDEYSQTIAYATKDDRDIFVVMDGGDAAGSYSMVFRFRDGHFLWRVPGIKRRPS